MNRCVRSLSLALLLAAGLGGCKFVETSELVAAAEAAKAAKARPQTSAGEWTGRVLPHMRQTAVPIATLAAALAGDGPEGAGMRYGHREGGEGTPFSYVVRVEGTIVEANTQSRAATAGVDTDGDGAADATLQLGPVIRGTAIRDVLPFVSFTDFENQIEFARIGKALNQEAYDTVLERLPREALVGASVTAIGAVTVRKADETLLVTPVEITVEAAS